MDVEDPADARLVSLQDMKHWELAPTNPGAIEKAGIPFCLTSSDLRDAKSFLSSVRKAIENGLSEKAAMDALTKTPATWFGVYDKVGSIEAGKWADLVIWKPAFFGVKPAIIMKGGFIAMAAMGDPNASIPTPQPVHYRPMFGSYGGALARGSLSFVSQAGLAAGIGQKYGLQKTLSAVKGIRGVGKRHMIHNDYTPKMEVDAQTYAVRADGLLLTCEPAVSLPMTQRYFLF